MSTHSRLVVLVLVMLGLLAAVVVTRISSAPPAAREFADGHVGTVHVFNAAGELIGPVAVPPVARTSDQWREILTAEQYDVVREAGTERPGSGPLLENKDDGVYTCVACRLPLFRSETKFDSGTGWPSFYAPIAADNVGEHIDRSQGRVRTEITCARCNGHLGHVFRDGPRPTGLRYCLNSAALSFTPAADVRSLAEPVAGDGAAGSKPSQATVVIAGGCFWCVEAVFEEIEGVLVARSGYAGGKASMAKYRLVAGGHTAHAEAVQLIYDTSLISCEELLRIHFATHDPTTLDRQGADVGPQYRSAIFYADEEQRAAAQAVIDELTAAHAFGDPIVTSLEPLERFFPAEDYHQDYVRLNPGDGYVKAVALPKVRKVRKLFPDRLKRPAS